MNKSALLTLIREARERAEGGDLGIAEQREIVSQLEKEGLPSANARAVLARLVDRQELDLTEMERLLDVMDLGPAKSNDRDM